MCSIYVHSYIRINLIGVNTILSVGVSYIREDSATLSSEMPCFFPDLLCAITDLTTNNMIVTVKSTTDNDNGLVMAYSYPNCIILLSDLNSGTTYNYCVVAINATTMVQVGEPVCGNFTTNVSYTESKCVNSLSHTHTHTQLNKVLHKYIHTLLVYTLAT